MLADDAAAADELVWAAAMAAAQVEGKLADLQAASQVVESECTYYRSASCLSNFCLSVRGC